MTLKSKYIVVSLSAISLILICCVNVNNPILEEMNLSYEKQKEFIINKHNDNIIRDAFPKNLRFNNKMGEMRLADSTAHDSLTGYFYFVYSLNNPETDLKNTLNGKILDSVSYHNNDNTIISLYNLIEKKYEVERDCNVEHPNKYPIPYFEDWNLGLNLGCKKITTLGKRKIPLDVYVVPSDLIVYVLSAKPIVIENSTMYRTELLKEWENGYSYGIAISKKENIIVYWFIEW